MNFSQSIPDLQKSFGENLPARLRAIAEKVLEGKRISPEEGVILYKEGELGFLGITGQFYKRKKERQLCFL